MTNLAQFDLHGRAAIVTGSGKGIGRALALGLAQAGADVVVVARTKSDVDEVAREIETSGQKALGVCADVTVKADVEALVQKAVKVFGKIDVLINNVGGGTYCPVLEMEEDAWHTAVARNLHSVYHCSRAVGKVMVQQKRGSIINISSGQSTWPSMGLAHYGAAKAGMHTFSQALALEWGPYNVRVNVLMPGITETTLTKRYYADRPEVLRNSLARIPLGRLAQPEDYVGAAIFLASDASAYITGAIIYARGGLTTA
ncbi:MAG: SDR family oxidoreductase [Chloroflexi bacterium]|nr:SDR family oxidoreductase [Chloroflexota bacterium]